MRRNNRYRWLAAFFAGVLTLQTFAGFFSSISAAENEKSTEAVSETCIPAEEYPAGESFSSSVDNEPQSERHEEELQQNETEIPHEKETDNTETSSDDEHAETSVDEEPGTETAYRDIIKKSDAYGKSETGGTAGTDLTDGTEGEAQTVPILPSEEDSDITGEALSAGETGDTGENVSDGETAGEEETRPAEETDSIFSSDDSEDPFVDLMRRDDLVIFDQSVHAGVSFQYDGKLSENMMVKGMAVPEDGYTVTGIKIFCLENGLQSLFSYAYTEEDAEGVVLQSYEQLENGSAAFSFEMPAQDVVLIAGCRKKEESPSLKKIGGAGNAEAEWGDKGEYQMIPDRFILASSLAGTTSEGWKLDGHGYTRYRECRIRYTTADGTVTDWMTVTAYCLQASKGDVASLGETTFDESNTCELTRRALILMSQHVFSATTLGQYFRDHGVTGSGEVFAMQHMIATYAYWMDQGQPSDWTWNAVVQKVTGSGPGVGGTGAKLNAQGEKFVKEVYELVKGYGSIDCMLRSSGKSGKSISFGKTDIQVNGANRRTPSITYDSIPENTLTLQLGNLILVNENTGARVSSAAAISGGTTFHLEAPADGAPSATVTGSCALFSEGESAISGSKNKDNQDLGFAGTTSSSRLTISAEWPDPLFSITVKKKDSLTNSFTPTAGYSLAGAVYGIYQDAACQVLLEKLTTGTDAAAVSGENYRSGSTFYVKEIAPPAGYETDQTVYPAPVTGADVIVTSSDMPKRIRIRIIKKDVLAGDAATIAPAYSLAGAEYTVYGDSSCTKALETMTTDDQGNAQSANLYPAGTYYVKETKIPVCGLYERDETVYSISADLSRVISGEAAVITSAEQPRFGAIRICKTDLETGNAYPLTQALSFAGAVFAVYTDPDCKSELMRLTTDEEGTAQTPDTLTAGSYWIRELQAPEGYICSGEVFEVSTDQMKQAIVSGEKTVTCTVPQQIIRGNVSIMKVMRDKYGKQQASLPEGIIFRFTYTADPSVSFTICPDPVLLDDGSYTSENVILTDAEGYASTADPSYPSGTLLYGEWLIEEHGAKEGYIQAEPVSVHISSPGQTLHLVLDNNQVSRYLKIVKEDANTGNRIPAAGVSFQIEDEEHRTLSLYDFDKKAYTDTWITDENGEVMLHEALDYGTYYLKETGGIPIGYTVMDSVPFSVTEGPSDVDHPIVLTAREPVQMGRIRVCKRDSADGRGLQGVTFQIFTKKEITDSLGTVRTGEDAEGKEVSLLPRILVDQVTTDEQGCALSKELFPGTYLIRESAGAQYYAVDETDYEVTILPDSSLKTAAEPVIQGIVIDNTATGIELKKIDELSGRGIKDTVFRIKEESQPDQDDQLYTTDTDGCIRLSGIFRHGAVYTVREVKPAPGYLPDGNITRFTVDDKGLIDREAVYRIRISNRPTRVTVSKQSMTGSGELPGARLQVRDASGVLIDEWISTDTPHEIDALPPGTYTLTEITAPEGFETAETITFTVLLTGEIQPVVMYDELLKEPVLETESEMVTEKPRQTEQEKKKENPVIRKNSTGPSGPAGGRSARTGDETRVEETVLLTVSSLLIILGLFAVWFWRRTNRTA